MIVKKERTKQKITHKINMIRIYPVNRIILKYYKKKLIHSNKKFKMNKISMKCNKNLKK